MAESELPAESADAAPSNISPAKRKKLQTYFQYGTDKRESGDHDYAHSMFSQCFVGDPANLVYLEAVLENLNAKFGALLGNILGLAYSAWILTAGFGLTVALIAAVLVVLILMTLHDIRWSIISLKWSGD